MAHLKLLRDSLLSFLMEIAIGTIFFVLLMFIGAYGRHKKRNLKRS